MNFKNRTELKPGRFNDSFIILWHHLSFFFKWQVLGNAQSLHWPTIWVCRTFSPAPIMQWTSSRIHMLLEKNRFRRVYNHDGLTSRYEVVITVIFTVPHHFKKMVLLAYLMKKALVNILMLSNIPEIYHTLYEIHTWNMYLELNKSSKMIHVISGNP